MSQSLVLLGGSIASSYLNGGIAWERLSWALGLRRLGLNVVVVDQLDRGHCVYPEGAVRSYESCLNRAYLEGIVQGFGLAGSYALVGEYGESLYGLSYPELLDVARDAELLVNVAGNVRLDELKRRPRRRVYVDVDPGFTQLWLASGMPAPRVEGHDLYFTIGENIGTPGCSLPTSGLRWRHTRQPLLVDDWPVTNAGDRDRYTTVARWRGSGPHGHLEQAGHRFSTKGDEFRRVISLPGLLDQRFEVALDMRPTDGDAPTLLEQHGWRLVDAKAVAPDPESFRRYVQNSGAEFSVAKGAYVATRSGWFSERTVRYLASGKPALVQDTGFARTIPVGEGLLMFKTLKDAVEGASRIASDYEGHAAAARRVAEEFFASDAVLSRLLDEVEAA